MREEVGGEQGKGDGRVCSQEASTCWVLCLQGFYLFLKGKLSGEASGEGPAEHASAFQVDPSRRGPLQAVGPTNWSVQGRGRQSSQLVLELSHSGGLPVVSREVPLCLLYVAGPVFSSLPQFPLPPVLSQRKLLLKGSCSPEVD